LLILPRLSTIGLMVPASWDTATRGLVLGFSVLAVAFVLAALSIPLYRILEGYLFWPHWLRERRTTTQGKRKARLVKAAETLERESLQADLVWEKADKYPVQNQQLAPTRLGNAIRAMETFAGDRYGLDSQRFWSELVAAAPASLSDANAQARGQVDFFVAMFYLTILFGLATLAAFFRELSASPSTFDLTALVVGVAVLLLPWIWYEMAIISVSFWRSSSQAVANTGRVPLATQLGLVLPDTLDEEREMWERLASLLFYPAAETTPDVLDSYRLKSAPTALVGTATSSVLQPPTIPAAPMLSIRLADSQEVVTVQHGVGMHIVDGQLRVLDAQGQTIAAFAPGQWLGASLNDVRQG